MCLLTRLDDRELCRRSPATRDQRLVASDPPQHPAPLNLWVQAPPPKTACNDRARRAFPPPSPRPSQAASGGGTWPRTWSGAGRRCGSHASGFRARVATFRLRGLRPTKPTKEPHDSPVPVFQWRRRRRPRRSEPASVPRPRGLPLPSLRDRFVAAFRRPPRDDGPGFLPDSRP